MIYLDNAATTYPKPECVYTTVDEVNRNAFNTGRGSYKVARTASKLKEEVRNQLLKINDVKKGEVVFTSSATRSLNDIIFGLDIKYGDNIYVSPFEHNSIIRPLNELKKRKNVNVFIIPFNKDDWTLNAKKMNDMFVIHNPKAIFLSQISNTTGYMLPYNDIFSLSERYNSINILDCAQGYGILKVENIRNINYLVFAGHKSLYATFGIAGYIKLKDDVLYPNVFGGTGSDTMNPNMSMEFPDGYEAGSPNIVAIAGLNTSIKWLEKTDIYKKEKKLTDYLINQLKQFKKVKTFIPQDIKKVFGVVSIGVDGYPSDDVGKILDDEFKICVRTGYHCSPLIHDFIESSKYDGTVRISIGYFNNKADIDTLIEALSSL